MSRAGERRSLGVPVEPRGTVEDLRALFLDRRPLLDVRAPVEFHKGAFPKAINLPLLYDEERHAVGIRYKQRGQDAAIALGADLLDDAERAHRVARWVGFANDHPDGVLYCFRGGLRSRIAQAWIADAGVELPLVTGGYKAMRSWLIDTLSDLAARLPLRIVGGRTGVGKTDLIKRLDRAIDLEGFANHRGSSFGGVVHAQPGNIDFENRVAIELLRFDADDVTRPGASAAPIWLEDEARLIGRVAMPESLVQAMRRAPIELLDVSLEVRVQNCLADYVVDLLERYRLQAAGEIGIEDEAPVGTGVDAGVEADASACGETDVNPGSGASVDASVDVSSDFSVDASARADVDERAFERFAAHHRDSLGRIRKRLGGDVFVHARDLLEEALTRHRTAADTAGYEPFIELLLTRYYDPMYDYQLESKRERIEFSGDADAILARQVARGQTPQPRR